ncbi:MAG: PQQ-binding-like beta-propeller repeat protein [Pirellulales bacterium]
MTVNEFLERLSASGLVSRSLVSSLRAQASTAPDSVSAESVAKLLVSQGHVSPQQAQRLLTAASDAESPGGAAAVADEDLGLVPLDDDDLPSSIDSPPPLLGGSPEGDRSRELPEATLDVEDESDIADTPLRARLAGEAIDLGDDEVSLVPLEGDQGLPPSEGADVSKKKRQWRDPDETPETPKARPVAPDNPWDSPLLLIGGGALILLVLLGATLWYMLGSTDSSQLLARADEQYRAGSYTQAIDTYNELLERYPSDESASRARVQRGLAQMRQAVDGSVDPSDSLEVARDVLDAIEDEPDFALAREELRAMLPQIASALVQQAEQADDDAQADQLLAQTGEAMSLLGNTQYIPRSLRPERKIENIRGTMDVVQRRLHRAVALNEAVAAIDSAIAQGDSGAAYAHRTTLLRAYPELASDAKLGEAVLRIVDAEQASVRVESSPIAAQTSERPSAVEASVALAAQTTEAAAGGGNRAATVRVKDSSFGLDAQTGALLWRRYSGPGAESLPVPLPGEDDAVLLNDAGHDDLVKLDARTGKLRWRLEIGEQFPAPLPVDDRALVATRGGRLLAVEIESGTSPRQAQLPQPLRVTPAYDADSETVLVVGDHSTLFVLKADDFVCEQAVYLGHSPGTVSVPPTAVAGCVIVAENEGTSRTTLHVLRRDPQGVLSSRPVQHVRLEGHVRTPPRVYERHLLVTTDLGQIKMFEVAAGRDEPLQETAEIAPDGKAPLLRYTVIHDNHLWIADTRLRRYEIQSASGRLVPQGLESPMTSNVADFPLRIYGDVLVCVRSAGAVSGARVTGVDLQSGRVRWETDLAAAPAGPPTLDETGSAVLVPTVRGDVHTIDAAVRERGLATSPRRKPQGGPPSFVASGSVALSEGRLALYSTAGAKQLLVFGSSGAPPRWVSLPSEIAGPPLPLGAGLLVPTRIGQVFWIDPTGNPLSEPFQPALAADQVPHRQSLAGRPGSPSEFVIADSRGTVLRAAPVAEPVKHWRSLAEYSGESSAIIPPLAVLGDAIFTVERERELVALRADDLEEIGRWELESELVFGPRRVGKSVLLGVAGGELICIADPSALAWQQAVDAAQIIGAQPLGENHLLLAWRGGTVRRLSAASGEVLGEIEVGQPLASGPALWRDRCALVADDGTLLLTAIP